MGELTLSDGQLERLADLVADRLDGRQRLTAPLVGVRDVAAHLAVDPSFVYEHADELGARRLGSGPKAALRFDLAEVDERLSGCTAGRRSAPRNPGREAGSPRRSRRRMGTRVDLLPIRGEEGRS